MISASFMESQMCFKRKREKSDEAVVHDDTDDACKSERSDWSRITMARIEQSASML